MGFSDLSLQLRSCCRALRSQEATKRMWLSSCKYLGRWATPQWHSGHLGWMISDRKKRRTSPKNLTPEEPQRILKTCVHVCPTRGSMPKYSSSSSQRSWAKYRAQQGPRASSAGMLMMRKCPPWWMEELKVVPLGSTIGLSVLKPDDFRCLLRLSGGQEHVWIMKLCVLLSHDCSYLQV